MMMMMILQRFCTTTVLSIKTNPNYDNILSHFGAREVVFVVAAAATAFYTTVATTIKEKHNCKILFNERSTTKNSACCRSTTDLPTILCLQV
jgi:hypothetical protein